MTEETQQTESPEVTEEAAPEAAEAATAPEAEETAAPAQPEADAEATEEAAEAVEAAGSDDDDDEDDDDVRPAQKKSKGRRDAKNDPKVKIATELKRLTDLATKYPEIGPVVAEVAFKTGYRDLGDRILRLGLDDDDHGVEYYFIVANMARRDGDPSDAIQAVQDALNKFTDNTIQKTQTEADRLLHLVRIGFAALLFDLEDLKARPDFVQAVRDQLPKLESFYKEDPFYHSLLAQAAWFTSKEESEQIWDQAAGMDESEATWNARGTWYKEAEKDASRAEGAYREGLKVVPESSLLLHNLAQILLDRAEEATDEAKEQAQAWVKEADALLRRATRTVTRRGLRRHIHSTIDRMKQLRGQSGKPDAEPPKEGDIVRGRVRSITHYGAFLSIGGGHSGLLHKSEIAHERVDDPNRFLKVGDTLEVKVIEVKDRDDGEGLRIGFSRKAVLPKPEKSKNDNQNRRGGGGNKGKGRGNNNNRNQNQNRRKKNDESLATLGEMLLAKLQDKEDNK